MTKEEAIKYLKQLYPNGGYTWLDEQRMEAITMAIEALSKASLPSNLDEAADNYVGHSREIDEDLSVYLEREAFKAGAKWMTSQGKTAEVGYWNQRGLSLRIDKPLEKLGYKEGDKVIVQIRKK